MLQYLGFTMFALGVSMADSESLYIPIGFILIGMLLIGVSEKIGNNR